MWEPAARAPASERPALTATIGLRLPTRRAIRANLRGFPNDSRYSSTTSVRDRPPSTAAGRCRRCPPCSRPRRTTTARGRARGCSITAIPTPPLWDMKPSEPSAGGRGPERRVEPHARSGVEHAEAVRADEPHSTRAGRPRPARAGAGRRPRPSRRTRPRSRRAPARRRPRTRGATPVTAAAGTATTATSTGLGAAEIERSNGSPRSALPRALTRCRAPVKSAARRLRASALPIVRACREA